MTYYVSFFINEIISLDILRRVQHVPSNEIQSLFIYTIHSPLCVLMIVIHYNFMTSPL